ncbi:hypothetical protein N24_1826 [Corynebacterium suranareeae]|uniref:Secreted protein n=1 Tax=Corynebacterium suranareeae TaxID=2506452 RepID=A0A161JMD0_9CORY|nr:hypothetical protein [Corynebacterium suranareeae]BAU96088.1 hypothetical protein N24_1826 [Corynebacterium suranareeae]
MSALSPRTRTWKISTVALLSSIIGLSCINHAVSFTAAQEIASDTPVATNTSDTVDSSPIKKYATKHIKDHFQDEIYAIENGSELPLAIESDSAAPKTTNSHVDKQTDSSELTNLQHSFHHEKPSNRLIRSVSYDSPSDTWVIIPTEDVLSHGVDTTRISQILYEAHALGLHDEQALTRQLTCYALGSQPTDTEWSLKGYRNSLTKNAIEHYSESCN